MATLITADLLAQWQCDVATDRAAATARRYLAAHPGDLVGLAALLGHSSLNTTRLYVQPTAEQLAERVECLDLNAYAG